MQNDLELTNQYGEKSQNQVTVVSQSLSDSIPAKTGVGAIDAIATANATNLAEALVLVNELKAVVNSLLAALKAV